VCPFLINKGAKISNELLPLLLLQLFVMGEVAVELFQESPTAFLQVGTHADFLTALSRRSISTLVDVTFCAISVGTSALICCSASATSMHTKDVEVFVLLWKRA